MRFIDIKTDGGRTKGKTAFYCNALGGNPISIGILSTRMIRGNMKGSLKKYVTSLQKTNAMTPMAGAGCTRR